MALYLSLGQCISDVSHKVFTRLGPPEKVWIKPRGQCMCEKVTIHILYILTVSRVSACVKPFHSMFEDILQGASNLCRTVTF